MYHALGWWDHRPHGEIRRIIAAIGPPEWRDMCRRDDGAELAAFQRETVDPRIWGGAVQIAAMARIRGVAILVHTDFGLQVFGQGPSWHIRHSLNPGHYDVIVPDPDTGNIGTDMSGESERAEAESQGPNRADHRKGQAI